jgi:hypothetical protein
VLFAHAFSSLDFASSAIKPVEDALGRVSDDIRGFQPSAGLKALRFYAPYKGDVIVP